MPFLILKLKRQLKLISEYKHRDYSTEYVIYKLRVLHNSYCKIEKVEHNQRIINEPL